MGKIEPWPGFAREGHFVGVEREVETLVGDLMRVGEGRIALRGPRECVEGRWLEGAVRMGG